MEIFRIIPDVERFKQLNFGDEQLESRFEELMLHGEPKGDAWQKPFAEWIEDRPSGSRLQGPYKTPDIAYIGGELALNPEAVDILKPLFSDLVEFLPVSVHGGEWALLNVCNFQDVFNQANSQYNIRPSGKVGRLVKMAIDKTKLTDGRLFKIIGKRSGWYTDDGPDSFKEIVERNGLSGLKFKRID
jgi:hypothetical protein